MKKILLMILFLFSFVTTAEETGVKVEKTKEKEPIIKINGDRLKEEFEKLRDKITVAAKKTRERLSLYGGIGMTNRHIEASADSTDDMTGPGFNTRFVYKIDHHWDLGISSYIYFGKTKNLRFQINGDTVESQGSFRTVNFAPTFKYISDIYFGQNWHLSFQLGPIWSIQTLKLKTFTDSDGVTRSNHKITYESRGGVIGIGLDEVLAYKEMHPVSVELLYSYMKGYQISLVDASDFTEVETVDHERRSIKLDGFILMLNISMLIF